MGPGPAALVAPDLVVAEVANAAWKLTRAGDMSPEKARRVAHAVASALDRLVPAAVLIDRAITVAQELDHPIYDCLYLALAEREAIHVVTTDRRLCDRVRGTSLEALVEPLGRDPD